jgi:hypothetical protein
MNERLQLLNNVTPYVGKYFSENWVRRHVLRMTDEDIEQLEQEMQEDAELNAQKMLENPQMDTGSGVEDISANQEFDRSA